MIAKQKQAKLLFLFTLILTLSLTIVGCSKKPEPTLTLEVSPGTEVQAGKSVAIVAKVEPLERLNLEWSVSGTGGGKLNAKTGEQVVYTAGKEGTDIVVAEGTTVSGASVKQTVTLIVVGSVEPSPSPESPVTPTPICYESFRPLLIGATDFAGDVEIKTPEDCTTGWRAQTNIPVAGTYEEIPGNADIWVLVYPHLDRKYFPQSLEPCEGEKLPKGGGKWEGQATMGKEGGEPEWFDIVVVLADQKVSALFSNHLIEGCKKDWKDYEGISVGELISMNVTEKDFITVQTRD